MLQYSQTVLGPMLQFDTESTICAISTGKEGAARGAIRITGPDSMELVERAFQILPLDNDRRSFFESAFPFGIRPSRCMATVNLQRLGSIPIELYLWPDGRSYTGQPSAEVHTLGAPILLEEIQNHLVQMGAKLAQPGEFTLRAFLAGRLDLTQCEAVLGAIHASSSHSLDVALKQLAGGLADPLRAVRQNLIHVLADIEAGLDFVDEDISFISTTEIVDRLTIAIQQVDSVLNQMESRAGQKHVQQVAIVGPPNAGKSSLLNALVDSPIAIVSPVPGTTRDYVRFRIQLGDVSIDLLDTAGVELIDEDSPRGIAQSFTLEQIENANLILWCEALDSAACLNSGPNADPLAISETSISESQVCWKLWTKFDLVHSVDFSDQKLHRITEANFKKSFHVSSVTRKGIEELLRALEGWAHEQLQLQSEVVPMTAERCWTSLVRTREALIEARLAAEQGHGDEVTASEIRIALDELGLVAGTVYNDDILDALFSRFCIGK